MTEQTITNSDRPTGPSSRAARDDDLDRILELNNGALPAVSELDRPALVHLVDQAISVPVVAVDLTDRVCGFAIVLDERADYHSENYRWFASRYERFAYVDRIVIADDSQGRGLGQLLYRSVLAGLPPDIGTFTCEVNVKPRNDQSLAFHERFGFQPVGEQDYGADPAGGLKRVRMLALSLGDRD